MLKVAETLRAARKLRKLIFDQLTRPQLSQLLLDISTLPDLQKLLEADVHKYNPKTGEFDFVKKGTASGSSAKLRVSISTKIEQFPSELNFPTIGMSGIGWPTKQ